jgi:hypothetical protein
MHYNFSKKMFTGRAKQIRIIGEPDNERPGKWSSTVLAASQEGLCSSGTVVTNGSAYLSLLSVNLQKFTGRAKQFPIIGEPDNQRPDNWRAG